MNLLSSTDLAIARTAMQDVFDTFKRSDPLRFYKVQNEIIIAQGPDYLHDFYNMQGYYSGIASSGNYVDIEARVIYLRNVDAATFVNGGEDLQIKARQDYGKIKIQIPSGNLQDLKDADRFWFNGQKYHKEENWRGLGIFGSLDYYSLTLSEVV